MGLGLGLGLRFAHLGAERLELDHLGRGVERPERAVGAGHLGRSPPLAHVAALGQLEVTVGPLRLARESDLGVGGWGAD